MVKLEPRPIEIFINPPEITIETRDLDKPAQVPVNIEVEQPQQIETKIELAPQVVEIETPIVEKIQEETPLLGLNVEVPSVQPVIEIDTSLPTTTVEIDTTETKLEPVVELKTTTITTTTTTTEFVNETTTTDLDAEFKWDNLVGETTQNNEIQIEIPQVEVNVSEVSIETTTPVVVEVETPKVELESIKKEVEIIAANVDLPVIEIQAPNIEAPKIETPKIEIPKIETPKVEIKAEGHSSIFDMPLVDVLMPKKSPKKEKKKKEEKKKPEAEKITESKKLATVESPKVEKAIYIDMPIVDLVVPHTEKDIIKKEKKVLCILNGWAKVSHRNPILLLK